MIIVMKPNTVKENIDKVIKKIEDNGLKSVPLFGTEKTVIAVIGDSRKYAVEGWKAMIGVESVTKILKPYKLASRSHNPKGTIIKVDDVEIGNGKFIVMAGPCSIESEEQIMESAKILKDRGIKILRASAFKPRSSPYAFQGMGIEGLKLLKKVIIILSLLILVGEWEYLTKKIAKN